MKCGIGAPRHTETHGYTETQRERHTETNGHGDTETHRDRYTK